MLLGQLVGRRALIGGLSRRQASVGHAEGLEVVLDQNVVQVDVGQLRVLFDERVKHAGEYVDQVTRQASAYVLVVSKMPKIQLVLFRRLKFRLPEEQFREFRPRFAP